MKTVMRYMIVVLIFIPAFISCGKKGTAPFTSSAPSPTYGLIDTLKGREFIFDLAWKESDDGIVWGTYTDYRPDLFYDPHKSMEVMIRVDTSLVWQEAGKLTPGYNGIGYAYFYAVRSEVLYIYPGALVNASAGTRVLVRIKFL